jgi:hypothetical protein
LRKNPWGSWKAETAHSGRIRSYVPPAPGKHTTKPNSKAKMGGKSPRPPREANHGRFDRSKQPIIDGLKDEVISPTVKILEKKKLTEPTLSNLQNPITPTNTPEAQTPHPKAKP